MKKNKLLIRFSLAFGCFLLLANYGFIYGQDALNDSDVLVFEVTRKGKGNIFPLNNQIYFRLYSSGRIEYDIPPTFDPEATKPNWDFVSKSSHLKEEQMKKLLKQVELINFDKLRSFYPPVENEIDALMVTKVQFNTKQGLKKITLHNIRLDNKKTLKIYSESLVKLLKMVVELRPKTEEEVNYKWDGLY